MAYTYLQFPYTSADNCVEQIFTLIENLGGWVLEKTISPQSKVFSHVGDGNRHKAWVHIYSETNMLKFRAYLNFDLATNTGYMGNTYNATRNTLALTTGECTFFGTRNFFFFNPRKNQVYTDMYGCGFPKTFASPGILTTLTSPVVAGSAVTLTVGSTTNLRSGVSYCLIGAVSDGLEQFSIQAVLSLTQIRVDLIAYNHAAGANIGSLLCPFIGLFYANFTYPSPLHHLQYEYNGTGLQSVAYNGAYHTVYGYQAGAAVVTSDVTKLRQLSSIRLNQTTYYDVGYMDDEFLAPSSCVYGDMFGYCNDSLERRNGNVGAATANSLTDGNKVWVVDELINKLVIITFATGINQVRKIISNTATTVTVNNWVTIPDVTSKYYICDELYFALLPTSTMYLTAKMTGDYNP